MPYYGAGGYDTMEVREKLDALLQDVYESRNPTDGTSTNQVSNQLRCCLTDFSFLGSSARRTFLLSTSGIRRPAFDVRHSRLSHSRFQSG